MKKSEDKLDSKKWENKLKDLIEDLNNTMNLVQQIDSIDLEKDDIQNLKTKAKLTEKNIKKKYKDIILENPENNLDTEE